MKNLINNTKYDFNPYLHKIADELGIIKNVTIAIVPLKGDLNKMYDGLTEEVFKDNYVVYLSELMTTTRSRIALIHEFVHIRDMVNNDLIRIPGTVNYLYKGEKYERTAENKDILPFELEAIKVSKKLVKKIFPRKKWLDWIIGLLFASIIVLLAKYC